MVHNGQIKIADLGLSKIRDEIAFKVFGHMAYIDPQSFKDKFFLRNEQSDIYALGIVLWELSSGKTPFEHLPSYLIAFEINNGQREKVIDGTPSEYVELYTNCWGEDPEKRPTIEFVLEALNKITWGPKITKATGMSKTQDQNFTSISSPVIISTWKANFDLPPHHYYRN